jgi:Zn-dependent protease with chaperone function
LRAKIDPEIGARRTYAATLALAGTGAMLTAGVIVSALAGLSVSSAPGHHLHLLGVGIATPEANAMAIVVLTVATLGIAVVLAGLRAMIVAVRSLRELQRALPVGGPLPGHEGVLVVTDEHVAAFCAGLWRPRVYITTGALAVLEDGQLEAVLAHEGTHRARRDPLRVVGARVLAEALFFLPLLRPLSEHYASLAELVADARAASSAPGSREALAAAMLAFGHDQITAERVDHLAGEGGPAWRLPLSGAVLSVAGIAALVATLAELARHAATQASLGIPALAGKPCVVTLALVPFAAVAIARWGVVAGPQRRAVDHAA